MQDKKSRTIRHRAGYHIGAVLIASLGLGTAGFYGPALATAGSHAAAAPRAQAGATSRRGTARTGIDAAPKQGASSTPTVTVVGPPVSATTSTPTPITPAATATPTVMTVTAIATLVPPTGTPVPPTSMPVPSTSTPRPAPRALRPLASTRVGPGIWPMYQHDQDHSGFNPTETVINRRTAHTLHLWWLKRTRHTIFAQPIVVGNIMYWGDWAGFEHATPISGGKDRWSAFFGLARDPNCPPGEVGIGSTPTYATVKWRHKTRHILYLGGGDGTFFAVNAANGRVVWRHFLGSPHRAWFLWSSPVVYKGSVYMGVASMGTCPNTRGAVVKLDAATGTLQRTLYTVPPSCIGGDVWGTMSIDQATGTLYVPTGNSGPCSKPEPYGQALLQVKASDLKVEGAWQVPASQAIGDSDFGTTATFFTARLHGTLHKMVGVLNKNGRYYAFERGRVGRGPVWYTPRLTRVGDAITPAAWDGTRLYVATHTATLKGRPCESTLRALKPATGAAVWVDCLAGGGPEGAVVATPGLVYAGIGSIEYMVNSATGKVLFRFQDTSFHWFWGPDTVANGVLYAINSDGNLYAFVPRLGR